MTVVHHGGWQYLRDEALRRNAAVARGEPDEFPPLPATPHRGELARAEKQQRRIAHAPGHRTRSDGRRVVVRDLLDAGLLAPGAALWADHKSSRTDATVNADGTLTLADGRTAPSLSAAQKLATGTAKNGWRWWRTRHHGRDLWLDELRDELIRRWRSAGPEW
jgi:hypothetical protein